MSLNPALLFERFRATSPDPQAPVLFCIPHVGSGAAVFRHWRRLFPESVEIAAIRLPGRERYINGAPLTSLANAARLVAEAITARQPQNFALYGQCSGALLAFEVAHELREQGGPAPRMLFVASQVPPDRLPVADQIHELPDDLFRDTLVAWNLIPPDLQLKDPLWDLVAPVLRADFAAVVSYRPTRAVPLDVPVRALSGAGDSSLSLAEVGAWKLQTDREFDSRVVPGGHVITESPSTEVVEYILDQWGVAAADDMSAGSKY